MEWTKMKKFDWSTFVIYMYFAFVIFVVVIGIAFMIGEIVFIFKTLTSSEIPFWLKWVMITRQR